MNNLLYGLLFFLVANSLCGHSKEEWKSRTIYQLLTDRFARSNGDNSPCYDLQHYCGGTYQGIINNLDYIQEMGFDAIWISPVVDNADILPRHGYHGYWARDWTKLNHHFGSEEDFRNFISECHRRDIWIMVDVVANHVAPVGTDYSSIYPFNRAEHYHDWCDIDDYDFDHNQWKVENCRLARLPDLKHENGWVADTLLAWVKALVQNYDIDGLRVDTVPEVPKWFWSKYTEAAGAFTIGEVFNFRWDYLRGYIGPLNSVLNYAIFRELREVFKGGSFNNFAKTIEAVQSYFGNELNFMGNFVDNHDNPRFLNGFGGWDGLMGALTFSLFFTGIPIVYYGDEQGYGGGDDPNNREELWTHMNRNSAIYQLIKKVNEVRKQYKVWNYPFRELWHKEHMMAFTRGPVLVVVTTRGQQVEEDVPNVPFPDGTRLCDIFTGYYECITVNGGRVHLSIPGNKHKVYVRH